VRTFRQIPWRDYFLYGKNVKKWSHSTSTVALCGIKFFYENTIKRPWPTLLFIRPGGHTTFWRLLRCPVNYDPLPAQTRK